MRPKIAVKDGEERLPAGEMLLPVITTIKTNNHATTTTKTITTVTATAPPTATAATAAGTNDNTTTTTTVTTKTIPPKFMRTATLPKSISSRFHNNCIPIFTHLTNNAINTSSTTNNNTFTTTTTNTKTNTDTSSSFSSPSMSPTLSLPSLSLLSTLFPTITTKSTYTHLLTFICIDMFFLAVVLAFCGS